MYNGVDYKRRAYIDRHLCACCKYDCLHPLYVGGYMCLYVDRSSIIGVRASYTAPPQEYRHLLWCLHLTSRSNEENVGTVSLLSGCMNKTCSHAASSIIQSNSFRAPDN